MSRYSLLVNHRTILHMGNPTKAGAESDKSTSFLGLMNHVLFPGPCLVVPEPARTCPAMCPPGTLILQGCRYLRSWLYPVLQA